MKTWGLHPNVLPLHCCFVDANELWFVMPLLAGGCGCWPVGGHALLPNRLATSAHPKTPICGAPCLILCPTPTARTVVTQSSPSCPLLPTPIQGKSWKVTTLSVLNPSPPRTQHNAGGSVAAIMRRSFPKGLDEATIATIAKPVLRALEYVHAQVRLGVLHHKAQCTLPGALNAALRSALCLTSMQAIAGAITCC